ncbi:MAG: hypothetical protein IJ252_07975, partial [Solobacterium sp.]|nr:hypothetical protein [Solobacterium sp.]
MSDRITVVCASNNREVLEKMLIPSVAAQKGIEADLKIYENKYPSAAETFVHAIEESDSDFICFAHQDLMFSGDDFLLKLVEAIKEEPNALYGLCGAKDQDGVTGIYSCTYHGIQNRNIGERIQKKLEVDGLDEIFLACHKDLFRSVSFDPETFDGWDLYVQDLCMQAKQKGIPVYVLPLDNTHKSILEMPGYLGIVGLYPDSFYLYLERLRNKYAGSTARIVCPCIQIDTANPVFRLKLERMKMKTKVKRVF